MQLFDLRQGEVVDQTRTVRGLRYIGVVHDHQHAVGGQAHVQLDHVGPGADGCFEGRKRVLGMVRRGAPMANHERPSPRGVGQAELLL